MKPVIYSLLLFLSFNLFGQERKEDVPYVLVQITLITKVHGQGRPAKGVEVKSPKATDGFTNEYGQYELRFPTKKRGDLVKLSIGNIDGNKDSIRLVNSGLVKDVALLNNPSASPLDLIVCKPEDYDVCFSNLHPNLKINKEEALTEIKKTKTKIRTGNYTSEEKFILKQKIIRLNEEVKRKEELIEEMARNLRQEDIVSPKNKNRDRPRKIGRLPTIDDENLNDAYNKAINKKIEFENEINRVVTKHRGRAYTYQQDSMFGKSAENYVKVCEILEENNFESKTMVGAYRDAALAFYDGKKYTQAGVFYQKSIYTILSDPKANKIALANLYHGLANTYKSNKNYEWAINSYKDGVEVIAGRYGESSHDLLFPYHGIALCYKSLKNIEKAEEYYLKSIAIINNDRDASVSDVLNTFNNAINFYKNIGQMDKATKLFDQSISKISDQVGSNNPMLVKLLIDMSNILRVNGEYEAAINKIDHALDIIEGINGKESQQYKNTESLKNKVIIDRANAYLKEGRFNEAISDFNNLIVNSGEGTFYYQRGICFYYLENYKRAQEDFRDAKNKNLSTDNTDYYLWTGLTYAKTNNRKEAEKALSNYKNTNPENGNDDMAWAAYFSIRNKKEDAIKYFKRGMEKGFQNIAWINKEKGFDNIRQEAVFRNYMDKMAGSKE